MKTTSESFDATTEGEGPFRFDLETIVDLLLRPERFFRAYLKERPGEFPVLAMWFAGMGVVVNSILMRLEETGAPRSGVGLSLDAAAFDWLTFWFYVVVGGILVGLLWWMIAGWWYGMRLWFSGAHHPDSTKARQVFIHSELIWSIPMTLTILMQVPFHENLQSTLTSGSFAMVWLTATVWSAFVSYRGAIGCFDVDREKARVWFLILPLLVFSLATVGSFLQS